MDYSLSCFRIEFLLIYSLSLFLQRKPAKKDQQCFCIVRQAFHAQQLLRSLTWCDTSLCHCWKPIRLWSLLDQLFRRTLTSWASSTSWNRVSSLTECFFLWMYRHLRPIIIFSFLSHISRSQRTCNHFPSHFLARAGNISSIKISWRCECQVMITTIWDRLTEAPKKTWKWRRLRCCHQTTSFVKIAKPKTLQTTIEATR